MSSHKGKAKTKSTAKTAGTKKKAVMNSRNPKKPMAISGDTMSNYAMYKKGGSVKKYKEGGPGDGGADSTMIYLKKAGDYGDIARKNVENEKVYDYFAQRRKQALSDAFRQKHKGQPGYDKYGFPVKKKGGSVKAKKFAALAPPYDKITAADRIAGAKKNARKK